MINVQEDLRNNTSIESGIRGQSDLSMANSCQMQLLQNLCKGRISVSDQISLKTGDIPTPQHSV